MLIQKYSFSNMKQSDEGTRQGLLTELATLLTARISSAADFDAEVQAVIADLKEIGHDLYMYDTDGDEWEVWCENWVDLTKRTNLIIYFYRNKAVEVLWSKHPE